jgi:hypothetical protein
MSTGPSGPSSGPRGPLLWPARRPLYKRKRVLIPAFVLLFLIVVGSLTDESGTQRSTEVELAASGAATTTTSTATISTEPTATTARPTTTKPPATTRARSKAPSPPTTRRPRPPATEAPASDCHPSYSGVCLRVGAGDYDCAGGSGNGPHYVAGPIRVRGLDPFDLDRDGNGVGCEG